MNSYTLVEYSANWADEIDLHGYFILNERELEKFNQILKKIKKFNFSFGTNESFFYESASDLESDLNYKEISEQEYKSFKRLKLLQVGIHPYYSLINSIEKTKESYEDFEVEDDLPNIHRTYVQQENKFERKIILLTDEDIEELSEKLKKNHG